MFYRSEINSRNYCIIVGYICEYGCMGPTWPFLLMFESRVERHSFYGIETLNGHVYSVS